MKISIITAVFLCVILAISIPAFADAKSFRLLDATQYLNKPDMSQYGFEKLDVIYGHFLWPNEKITDEVPPEATMARTFLKYTSSKNSTPWCIDIEHWPLNGGDLDAEKNRNKLLHVLATARRINPTATIGLYGEVPMNNYYPSIAKIDSEQGKKWRSDNLRSKPLADAVDYIFPSIYTYYNEPAEWVLYAQRQIEMARIYKKPVYAFIWPQYHDSNNFHAFEYIDRMFWRLQLETIYKYADGVVIWGGWDFKNSQRAQWNENAGWWIETKDFIHSIDLRPSEPKLNAESATHADSSGGQNQGEISK